MSQPVRQLLDDVMGGARMTEEEAAMLLRARGPEVWDITHAADMVREEKVGNIVTYVRNQNLHLTNICKNLCGFCGFGVPPSAKEAYLFTKEEIEAEVKKARKRQVTELCFLSGVHPDFDTDRYVELLSFVHGLMPEADLHTMSPDEVAWAAKKDGISTQEVLERMVAAGLGTLQGTAAEILVDDVRKTICPAKVPTAEWVRIIREAHRMGIKSTSTIMYGSVETERDRAEHLGVLRAVQDETGGFTELVPLSYLHEGTALHRRGLVTRGATGREDILLFAVSRLFLDNFDNIQISWGKIGARMASLGMLAGGNDFGGTMFVDEVSTDAGAEAADYFDPAAMKEITDDLGRVLKRRSTIYEILD